MKDIKMMAAVVAATIGAFGAYAAGGGTTVSLTPLNLTARVVPLLERGEDCAFGHFCCHTFTWRAI